MPCSGPLGSLRSAARAASIASSNASWTNAFRGGLRSSMRRSVLHELDRRELALPDAAREFRRRVHAA
jgi:hypothetical protein